MVLTQILRGAASIAATRIRPTTDACLLATGRPYRRCRAEAGDRRRADDGAAVAHGGKHVVSARENARTLTAIVRSKSSSA